MIIQNIFASFRLAQDQSHNWTCGGDDDDDGDDNSDDDDDDDDGGDGDNGDDDDDFRARLVSLTRMCRCRFHHRWSMLPLLLLLRLLKLQRCHADFQSRHETRKINNAHSEV